MKESKHLNFIKPYIMIGRKLVYDNPNGKFLYEHWGGRNPFGKDVDKLTEFIDNYSFDELKKYVEENIDEICNELDTRWLLSLCELYVDLSKVIKDKSDALVIITFIRIIQTTTAVMKVRGVLSPEWTKEKREESQEKYEPLYPSMHTILWDGIPRSAGHDNIYINLFTRISSVLKDNEVMFKIWIKVATVLLDAETSFIALDNKHRSHWKEVSMLKTLLVYLENK